MIRQTSISRLIMAVMIATAAVAALMGGFILWRGVAEYSFVRHAQRLAQADRDVYDLHAVSRVFIGTAGNALVTEDDPRASIAKVKATVERLTGGTRDVALRVEFEGRDGLLSRLSETAARQSDLFGTVEVEAAKPKAERQLKAIDPWYQAALKTADAVQDISLAIGNDVRKIDAPLADLVQIRISAWNLRVTTGRYCPTFRPNVAANEAPTPAQIAQFNEWKGRAAEGWGMVDRIAASFGSVAGLKEAVAAGRAAYDETTANMEKLLAALGGAQPPMTPGNYTTMCRAPYQVITYVGYAALNAALAHLEDRRSSAVAVIAVAVPSFLVAVGLAVFGSLTIRRRVAQPMRVLDGAAERLSRMEFNQPVPQFGHHDELGKLAETLEALRHNALTAQTMERDTETRRQTHLTKAARLGEMCHGFDQSVSRVLEAVSRATTELGETAQSMSVAASTTDRQAAAATAATGRASASVETVAAAAEELSVSIREIAHQVEQSNTTARVASQEADLTNDRVRSLAESSARIGEVVNLINDIAGLTNLLALNATIEAARAGDAGKGFAVVAGEVKNLANQTAKATGEISAQIGAVQAATHEAVEAIAGIVGRIEEISHIAAAISAAVEQQSAATQNIAEGIQQASEGTLTALDAIRDVAKMASESGHSAGTVLTSAQTLSSDASGLQTVVDTFLTEVRRDF